jgi:hypothetical protein
MTTPIPTVNFPGAGTRLQSELQTYLNTMLAINMEMLGATAEAPTATISSNTFTPGNDYCVCPIDTGGGAATLNTIQATNIRDGQVLFLRIVNNANVVTIANNATGPNQIYTADGNNIVLGSTKQFLALKYKAGSVNAWEEIFRTIPSSAIIAAGNLSPLFTTTIASQTLNFTLTNAGAGTIFGNFSGSSGAPSYNSPGSADQVLGAAHTGGGLEYKTIAPGTGIAITPTAGQISIAISTPVSIANGGTGAATVAADSWFGNATSSTAAPAFNTSVFPNSLVNWAAPSAIGSTTPAAGTFTTLTLSTTPLAISSGGIGAATVAAHSWFGNATGSTAAPAFNTSALPLVMGGTGTAAASAAAAFNALAPATAAGGTIVGTGTNTYGNLAAGTNTQQYVLASGTPAWAYGLNGFGTANATATLLNTTPSYNTTNPGSTVATLTLPACSTCAGKVMFFEYVAGTVATTLKTNQSVPDTFDGTNTTIALSVVGQVIGFISDGVSNWRVVERLDVAGTGITLSFSTGQETIAVSSAVPTSSGNLSPLFTSTISSNALSFTLSNTSGAAWFGATTAGAPSYQTGALPTGLGGTGVTTATAASWFGATAAGAPGLQTGALPVALGGTGAATGTNPSWFGCSGSTTPAFQTGQIPNSLIDWAAPSAIGSTTANTGAFTTLGATGAFTQSATSQNQGPLANNGDFLGDWLISGYTPPSLPTSTLTCTFTGNTTLISQGCRVYIASGSSALTNTYTASKDTYVDMSATGVPTYTAVAIGATPPAVASGCMRLAKVESLVSTVTGVTILAQTSPPQRGQSICQGRLYGSGGSPYGDVSGTSTIYFGASNAGNQIALMPTASGASISTFNQMNLQTFVIPTVSGVAQVSASLSGLTAGTPYDIYVYWEINSGTLIIDTPVPWTGSGTFTPPSRSVGLDGRQYKNGDYSRLWVGSIIAASATTANNNAGDRGIINVYNRVVLPLFGIDSNTSWTGSSTTFATMDANTTNGQQRVRWLEITGTDAIQLSAQFFVGNSTAGTANTIAINVDNTGTSPNVASQMAEVTASYFNSVSCQYVFRIAAGLHYAQVMYKVGGGTATFYSIFAAYVGYLQGSILG